MKTYEIRKFENGFKLGYTRNIDKKLTLNFWLNKYNVDDYLIYKGTRNYKNIKIDELLDEKFACYIFFHKDYYNKDNIDKSIEYIYKLLGNQSNFLIKPIPSIKILQKIKIIEKIF